MHGDAIFIADEFCVLADDPGSYDRSGLVLSSCVSDDGVDLRFRKSEAFQANTKMMRALKGPQNEKQHPFLVPCASCCFLRHASSTEYYRKNEDDDVDDTHYADDKEERRVLVDVSSKRSTVATSTSYYTYWGLWRFVNRVEAHLMTRTFISFCFKPLALFPSVYKFSFRA